jgi:hypothetical protein
MQPDHRALILNQWHGRASPKTPDTGAANHHRSYSDAVLLPRNGLILRGCAFAVFFAAVRPGTAVHVLLPRTARSGALAHLSSNRSHQSMAASPRRWRAERLIHRLGYFFCAHTAAPGVAGLVILRT